MGHARFKSFYELEQAYYQARRELADARTSILVEQAICRVYRELIEELWRRLKMDQDELRTALAIMEGGAAVDVLGEVEV
jgi:hypothetical protein